MKFVIVTKHQRSEIAFLKKKYTTKNETEASIEFMSESTSHWLAELSHHKNQISQTKNICSPIIIIFSPDLTLASSPTWKLSGPNLDKSNFRPKY